MPRISQLYFKTAVLFFLAGIGVGLKMAISGDHNVIDAHAHINLLGWVSCAIFGGYFALNPAKAQRRLAFIQYGIYVVGVAMVGLALYFMSSGYPEIEPLAGIASLIILVAVMLFAVIVYSADQNTSASYEVESPKARS